MKSSALTCRHHRLDRTDRALEMFPLPCEHNHSIVQSGQKWPLFVAQRCHTITADLKQQMLPLSLGCPFRHVRSLFSLISLYFRYRHSFFRENSVTKMCPETCDRKAVAPSRKRSLWEVQTCFLQQKHRSRALADPKRFLSAWMQTLVDAYDFLLKATKRFSTFQLLFFRLLQFYSGSQLPIKSIQMGSCDSLLRAYLPSFINRFVDPSLQHFKFQPGILHMFLLHNWKDMFSAFMETNLKRNQRCCHANNLYVIGYLRGFPNFFTYPAKYVTTCQKHLHLFLPPSRANYCLFFFFNRVLVNVSSKVERRFWLKSPQRISINY